MGDILAQDPNATREAIQQAEREVAAAEKRADVLSTITPAVDGPVSVCGRTFHQLSYARRMVITRVVQEHEVRDKDGVLVDELSNEETLMLSVYVLFHERPADLCREARKPKVVMDNAIKFADSMGDDYQTMASMVMEAVERYKITESLGVSTSGPTQPESGGSEKNVSA